MSRAFVNEDHFVSDLPDRPVSPHPNHVTERGLELIEASLEDSRRAYSGAQSIGDREALAKAARDVRYWSARRSAQSSRPSCPASTPYSSAVPSPLSATTAGGRPFELSARTKRTPRWDQSRTCPHWRAH